MVRNALSTVTIRTWKKVQDSRKDCVGVVGANELFGKWMTPIPGVEIMPQYWRVDITLPIGMETTWRWVIFDKVTNKITQFENVEERKLVIPAREMFLLAPWNQTEWHLSIGEEDGASNVITCLKLQHLTREKNKRLCVYQASENGIAHGQISKGNPEKSMIDENQIPQKINYKTIFMRMRTSDKPILGSKIISPVGNLGPNNTVRILKCMNNNNKDSSVFEVRKNQYVDRNHTERRITEPNNTRELLPELAKDTVTKKESARTANNAYFIEMRIVEESLDYPLVAVQIQLATLPMAANVSVITIRTCYKVDEAKTQCLGIMGSDRLLGGWMTPFLGNETNFGYWKVEISLPVGTRTEWKWILFDKVRNEIIRWENLDRTLVVPDKNMYMYAGWETHEWHIFMAKEEDVSYQTLFPRNPTIKEPNSPNDMYHLIWTPKVVKRVRFLDEVVEAHSSTDRVNRGISMLWIDNSFSSITEFDFYQQQMFPNYFPSHHFAISNKDKHVLQSVNRGREIIKRYRKLLDIRKREKRTVKLIARRRLKGLSNNCSEKSEVNMNNDYSRRCNEREKEISIWFHGRCLIIAVPVCILAATGTFFVWRRLR
ncbi:hypothetical protein CHS0354_009034 [Potamilus streckersoni]|uniref:CBM20 domain-containing protein n=1 Tax=Potamilus streckersoni TaxID=2493646 RepID=A0AAE0THS7_9BIVA|nr:hypothetical protein CHS0354_009034 [Potamilus streckersoni]